METSHLEGELADLRRKFELLLEDYAALHAALLAMRREAREQHELMNFLLRAVAADLAAHRVDAEAHRARPGKATGRPTGRPVHFTAHPSAN